MSGFPIPSTAITDGSIVVGPSDDITYYGALTIGGDAALTVEGTLTVSDNQDDVETLIDGGDTLTLFNGPEPVGPPRYEYPFRMNGDRASALFAQDYWQRTDKWVPAKLSTPFTPASDFYLIAETDPVSIPGGIYEFTRLFARVPSTQTVPTSAVVVRPELTGEFPQVWGGFRLFQPDETLAEYDAYTAQTVTSDSGAASSFYPTGGTYDLTFEGQTASSIAYNASAGTVQTALNALSEISNRGNVAVSGSYNSAGGLVIAFNSYAAATTAVGSLTSTTGSTVGSSIISTNSGYTQALRITATGIDATSPSFDTSSLTYSGTPTTNGAVQNSTTLDYQISGGITITGGTYTLTALGQTTAAIAYNANSATVQAAVEAALTNLLARGTLVVSATFFSNNLRVTILVYPKVSGGTYTITMFGQTTGNIAYNATAAQIQTALNALTEVQERGNCVVTGEGFGFGYFSFEGITCSINFANPVFTASAASLTPAPCTVTPSITDAGLGRTQKVAFAATTAIRSLYVENHGFADTDTLYAKTDSTYTVITAAFTLPDENTVILNLEPGLTESTATAITELGKRTKESYRPGSSAVVAYEVTSFYLPGVTEGITTADDITIPQQQSDDATLLAAIFAGSETINYEVGALSQWRGSTILALTKTTVNAANL